MFNKNKTRIGLGYSVGGRCGFTLDDALYRIVRGIYDTTFYECRHEWSFEEIVHKMTICITNSSNCDYEYAICGYIDTDSYIGDKGYKKWGEEAYQRIMNNGRCIYAPSKEFKDFYNECLEKQTRIIKNGVFVCTPAYDAILSFFKNVMCEYLEEEMTMYDAITDAIKNVLCGKEKEVYLSGDDDFLWKDPFFH